MQFECKNTISYCSATKFRTGPIQVKEPALIVLHPIVVVVHIGGLPAHTLIDSGSLSYFMSETV